MACALAGGVGTQRTNKATNGSLMQKRNHCCLISSIVVLIKPRCWLIKITQYSEGKTDPTRMHSSRMRTAHSSSRPGGSPPGTPPGADLPGGGTHPPTQDQISPWNRPPLLTESQTPVKILPCPNFIAGRNKRELIWIIYLGFVFQWNLQSMLKNMKSRVLKV